MQPRSQDRGSQKMTNEQALEVKWLAYCTSIASSFTRVIIIIIIVMEQKVVYNDRMLKGQCHSL